MCYSDFDYFSYASSATAAVRNNASVKFVAHSEGDRVDNWTEVKINIFLTKIGAISINQLDSYWTFNARSNSTIVSAYMNLRVPVIIESVDSICRDSADTQYMLIQTEFSKSLKQLTYKPL